MNRSRSADLILYPVLSEKSMDVSAQGKYVFMVDQRATKPDIKSAIRDLYGVTVRDVHIVKLPSKPKRWGFRRFKTKVRVKAIVTLAEGQTIPEITEAV